MISIQQVLTRSRLFDFNESLCGALHQNRTERTISLFAFENSLILFLLLKLTKNGVKLHNIIYDIHIFYPNSWAMLANKPNLSLKDSQSTRYKIIIQRIKILSHVFYSSLGCEQSDMNNGSAKIHKFFIRINIVNSL